MICHDMIGYDMISYDMRYDKIHVPPPRDHLGPSPRRSRCITHHICSSSLRIYVDLGTPSGTSISLHHYYNQNKAGVAHDTPHATARRAFQSANAKKNVHHKSRNSQWCMHTYTMQPQPPRAQQTTTASHKRHSQPITFLALF